MIDWHTESSLPIKENAIASRFNSKTARNIEQTKTQLKRSCYEDNEYLHKLKYFCVVYE